MEPQNAGLLYLSGLSFGHQKLPKEPNLPSFTNVLCAVERKMCESEIQFLKILRTSKCEISVKVSRVLKLATLEIPKANSS